MYRSWSEDFVRVPGDPPPLLHAARRPLLDGRSTVRVGSRQVLSRLAGTHRDAPDGSCRAVLSSRPRR